MDVEWICWIRKAHLSIIAPGFHRPIVERRIPRDACENERSKERIRLCVVRDLTTARSVLLRCGFVPFLVTKSASGRTMLAAHERQNT